MLGLSPMRGIRVDPAKRVAKVEPGVTLGELDTATQAHALATPLGINSTTGVAGLALGGGFGWLSRKFGLTVDSLLAADVVTADARRLRVSQDSSPDLFWAIRGGGGNFGVVSSFEFRLHPVGPEVLAGLIVHPFADARGLLQQYRELTAKAPDDLTVWVVMRKAPPLPFLPAEYHGQEVLVLAARYAGRVREGAWARELFEATRPFATGGVYVNFMPFDEGDRVESAYGKNYERLLVLKRKYDPDNLFRMNQNIRPDA